MFPFSRERVVFWGVVWKISRVNPGKGVFFVIANGYQFPRWGGGGGVQVMGNEHYVRAPDYNGGRAF